MRAVGLISRKIANTGLLSKAPKSADFSRKQSEIAGLDAFNKMVCGREGWRCHRRSLLNRECLARQQELRERFSITVRWQRQTVDDCTHNSRLVVTVESVKYTTGDQRIHQSGRRSSDRSWIYKDFRRNVYFA
jgi:hypothetical protein